MVLGDQFPGLLDDEFRSIVRPDVFRDAFQDESLEQIVNDLLGGNPPGHNERVI